MDRKSLSALLLLTALAGCASTPRGEIHNRPLSANPSAFVSADMALARLAQEKGQQAAFREMAHAEAQFLTPQLRALRDVGREQAAPSVTMRWQPHQVILSCDGNVGVTQGAWQQGDQQGQYVTLWQRDERGRFRWRYDGRVTTATAVEAPEYIATRQATCQPRAVADASVSADGRSQDQSLSWKAERQMDGSASLAIRLWNGTEMVPVDRTAPE
jgi:hypothetical protein